jgi:hypothetical protein
MSPFTLVTGRKTSLKEYLKFPFGGCLSGGVRCVRWTEGRRWYCGGTIPNDTSVRGGTIPNGMTSSCRPLRRSSMGVSKPQSATASSPPPPPPRNPPVATAAPRPSPPVATAAPRFYRVTPSPHLTPVSITALLRMEGFYSLSMWMTSSRCILHNGMASRLVPDLPKRILDLAKEFLRE